MDIEIYFESVKVSNDKKNQYERLLEEKKKEIISELTKRLNERYSIQIDIKNNCIVNNKD